MADSFTIAKFRDVSEGLQAGQFNIGDRHRAGSIGDLDPILILSKPHVVANTDFGQDDSEIAGNMLADAGDAL